MILWGLSPALLVLPAIALFGRQWPYMGWLVFFAGALNMYAWSALLLWSKRGEHWEIRAVPLSLLMLVLNLVLVIAGEALLTALGIGAGAGPPASAP